MTSPLIRLLRTLSRLTRRGIPAAFVILLTAPHVSLWGTEKDSRWYAVYLNNKKVGKRHVIREVKNDRIHLTVTQQFEIRRAGISFQISQLNKYIHRKDGRLLTMSVRLNQNGRITRILAKPENQSLRLDVTSGGRSRQYNREWGDDVWLGERLTREINALLKGKKKRLKYRVFEPQMLDLVNVESHLTGHQDISWQGETIRAAVIQHQTNLRGMQLTVKEYYRPGGQLIREQSTIMGMNMRIEPVRKQAALAKNESIEIFQHGFISSPRRLTRSTRAARLRYTITLEEPFTFPHTAEQAVSPGPNKQTVRITVTPKAEAGKQSQTKAAEDYLKPSRYIEADDPAVQKLANLWAYGVKKPATVARLVQSHVNQHIVKKSLSVGYAGAADTAKTREGDCTEHAVLMAAVLRAKGIPARVAFGLAYVPSFKEHRHVFIGHAWTQAYINGRWRSYDAALERFDSGHILLGTSRGEPAFSALAFFIQKKNAKIVRVEKVK